MLIAQSPFSSRLFLKICWSEISLPTADKMDAQENATCLLNPLGLYCYSIMTKLVVFLGNPGLEYRMTRHNIAWTFCDKAYGQLVFTSKFHSLLAQSGQAYFQKPQTFMNLSGRSAREASSFFHIDHSCILAVHDDMELGFAEVKLERTCFARGHNGLRSMASELGTGDFFRLRLGIGRPQQQDPASYVLSRFSKEQEEWLDGMFSQAKDVLEQWLET